MLVITSGQVQWHDDTSDFDWNICDSVPPTLKGRYTSEPKYVDLRPFAGLTDLSLSNTAFVEAVAPIAAQLHGQTVGELFSEEARQHRRMIRARNGAIAALTTLLCATTLMSVLAVISRQRAVDAREDALRTARIAQARALAAQSVASRIAGRPHQATLLALEAVAIHADSGEQPLLQSRSALYGALAALSGTGVGAHSVAATAIAASPDGAWLATGDAAGDVSLWRLEGSRPQLAARHHVHSRDVSALAFDGAGGLLSAGRDTTVYRLDSAAGSAPRLLARAGGRIESMSVYHDGRILIASGDGVAELLPGKRVSVHKNIMEAALHPGGRWLVTAGADGVLRSLDLRRPDATERELDRHESGLLTVQFSEDGRWLVACGLTDYCTLADAASLGRAKFAARRLVGHRHSVFHATFNRAGTVVATASDDGRVGLWSTSDPNAAPVFLDCGGGPVRQVRFVDEGTRLFASAGRNVCGWRLGTESRGPLPTVQDGHVWTGHDDDVLGLVTAGRSAYSIGRDGLVRAWTLDPTNGAPAFGEPLIKHADHVKALQVDSNGIMSADQSGEVCFRSNQRGSPVCMKPEPMHDMTTVVELSPRGQIAAVGTRRGLVRLCRIAADALCPAVFRHPAAVTALALDAKEEWLVSADAVGRIGLHELATATQSASPTVARTVELPRHTAAVSALVFGRSSDVLLSADFKGGIRFDTHTDSGWSSQQLSEHREIVRSATFANSGTRFATYGTDAWAAIWDVDQNGQASLHTRLSGHLQEPLPLGVQTVLFSRDGKTAVSAGADATVRVWDLTKQQPSLTHRVLYGHGQGTFGHGVKSLALTPDDAWLASGGEDGTLRLWDLHASNPGREAIEIVGHNGAVTLVRFDNAQRYVITAGDDGAVRAWPFALTELIDTACRTLSRDFSSTEVTTFLDGVRDRDPCAWSAQRQVRR
jgi:WD40 repeat protein